MKMNVDAIFVISVKGYEDRRCEFKKRHKGMPFQFVISNKGTEGVRKSVFRNHENIVRISKQKGFDRVLIFEDDAFPLKKWNEIVKYTNNALEEVESISNRAWKHLMIGYLPIKSKPLGVYINKIECAYDGHAYIVNINNVNYLDWDIDNQQGVQHDSKLFCNNYSPGDVFTKDNPNVNQVYATKEIMYIQKAESSSRTGDIDDHIYYYIVFPNINTAVKISEIMNVLHFFVLFIILILIVIFIIACIYMNRRRSL